MAERSERFAHIDYPSHTVDTPLQILTRGTNGLPGPVAHAHAPENVMDKRGPVDTSLHDEPALACCLSHFTIERHIQRVH